jgi:predicted transcriptional regulator
MSTTAKSLVDRLSSWPAEDIQELEDYARVIEARRTGVYVMSDDERAAVMRGLEQARRGQFVSDEEVEAFWKRCGVK